LAHMLSNIEGEKAQTLLILSTSILFSLSVLYGSLWWSGDGGCGLVGWKHSYVTGEAPIGFQSSLLYTGTRRCKGEVKWTQAQVHRYTAHVCTGFSKHQ
jgi:hypothetical protein